MQTANKGIQKYIITKSICLYDSLESKILKRISLTVQFQSPIIYQYLRIKGGIRATKYRPYQNKLPKLSIRLSVCLSVRLSVRPSACPASRVCSVGSTVLVGSISYVDILSHG